MQPTHRGRGRALRDTGAAAAVVLALLAGAAPAASAATGPDDRTAAASAARGLDREALARRLDAVHEAGMYGAYSSVRDGRAQWTGATGFADVDTRRPTRPDMRHRVGSITKTFTATAVLQQSARGRIALDRPVGDYLPGLVPGERGRKITVRMLLNHTSGIDDYIIEAFPSLRENSPQSLDDFRYRTLRPATLIGYGMNRPQLFEPGTDWSYSNTNYLLLGELLREVTGEDPERVITRDVIREAGLRSTYFPGTDPVIRGPHSKMYENLRGLLDPPRDYSDYNMTMAGTAGALVSTTQDLNTFYRALLQGDLLPAAQLREMRTTVPVKGPDGAVAIRYGLGIYSMDTPCGPAWGHDGGVFGASTQAMSSADGKRQFAAGYNLTGYQRADGNGAPVPHPIDAATDRLREQALCGTTAPATGRPSAPRGLPEPLDARLTAPR
ncbi:MULTISPECIES: serine hydrolase [unclassified Streptomyces]|uniref:serine hydrolase domain-containing protein n=1 Tax=unclassified Streptomyces TaxID=2593676 RepID=UPI00225A5F2D|nr:MULTISPECIES: serine hydrolase domain-containing protein [unclassified Streptomyces]MCX4524446.1 beta-lactamase family protein [Streptomyces sp. NBC_01551]MCX4545032.1 beta-lactamase family protein [Streptomyces sp. NBC_01565]